MICGPYLDPRLHKLFKKLGGDSGVNLKLMIFGDIKELFIFRCDDTVVLKHLWIKCQVVYDNLKGTMREEIR